jgi:hypothetical protein
VESSSIQFDDRSRPEGWDGTLSIETGRNPTRPSSTVTGDSNSRRWVSRRWVLGFGRFPARRTLRLLRGCGWGTCTGLDRCARRRGRGRRAFRRWGRRGGDGSRGNGKRRGNGFGCRRRRSRCGREGRWGGGRRMGVGRGGARPGVDRDELTGTPCVRRLEDGRILQEQIRMAAGAADARAHGQFAPRAQR